MIRPAWRLMKEVSPRLLARFLVGLGWHGSRSVRLFRRRAGQGVWFPAFWFVSVTDACNLACRGCWARPGRQPRTLPLQTLKALIRAGAQRGARVWGILGGEPLLYPDLCDVFDAHRDCYFILFTNGTLLTPEVARRLRRAGNVTPLVSIEGREHESDVRRGGRGVYPQSVRALHICREQRLVTGVATSVCQSNFHEVVNDVFLNDMAAAGAHYLWYYIYRPVGPEPSAELALNATQVRALRRFLVEARSRAPLVIIDAYWDHEGRPLCPAAAGISYHVGPAGDIEPCPPIQFSSDAVTDGNDLWERVTPSPFLREFRSAVQSLRGGCVLLEAPALLRDCVVRGGARDTTGRGTGLAELAAMTPRCSHRIEGDPPIPERSRAYRWAKKRWFFGLGAYG